VSSVAFVLVPHFQQKAVLYWYVKESGDEENDRRYSVCDSRFDCVPFAIEDGGRRLSVRSEEAETVHASRLRVELGGFRYTASYVGQGDYINALGVISDDGASFGAAGEVPLVLTSMSPARFSEFMQEDAGTYRSKGFFALWVGLALTTPWLRVSLLSQVAESEEWVLHSFLLGLCLSGVVLAWYWVMHTFNVLTKRSNQIANAFHLISIDSLQRAEIVPKLETLVAEYCAHEQQLLTRLAALRTLSESETTSQAVEHEYRAAQRTLVALYENNPELVSREQFQTLSDELIRLENKIANDRHFYNENVAVYNTLVTHFPTNIVAMVFGHTAREFYEGDLLPAAQRGDGTSRLESSDGTVR
jgi:LemA protein